MKRKPIIAVVGRPNVGKSTFVNRLVGRRQSIVDDMPGVTRDRIYFDVEWQNKQFTVIDTGGIIPGDEDDIMLSIYDQAKIACEEADKIIFIVDGMEGATPVDIDIANILRQSDKPIFLAVNKVDSHNQITMISDFYSLAVGDPIAISALHGSGGVGDLLEEITADFTEDEKFEEDKTIKIAIVGRPNAGKSSIVNALLGEKRVIVSDVSGTTRDSIDSRLTYENQEFVIIDTAGIRKTTDKVEYKKIKITHKIFYGALSLFSTYISYSYIQSSSCLSTCQSNINQLSKKLAEGWYQKAKKQIPNLPDFREQLFQIDTYRFLEHDLGLCKGFFLHERILSKIQDIPLIFNSKLHEFYLKLNSIKNTLLGRNSLQLYKSE